MNPFVYLIVFLLVVAFVVLLPLIGGIGSYSVDKKTTRRSGDAKDSEKARSLAKYAKLKKEDAPVKFKVSSSQEGEGFGTRKFEIDGKTGLKKRVIGKYNEDEAEFDYDVDELIAEDLREQQQEEAARYAQYLGKENETQENLV